MLPPPPRSTLFPYTTLFRSETLDYLLRELLLPNAGLASAQDADTDGVEGLTYTWTREDAEGARIRSEEHTSELQSHSDLVCRLLLEKKKPPVDRSPSW